jgi:hypothetical protein
MVCIDLSHLGIYSASHISCISMYTLGPLNAGSSSGCTGLNHLWLFGRPDRLLRI